MSYHNIPSGARRGTTRGTTRGATDSLCFNSVPIITNSFEKSKEMDRSMDHLWGICLIEYKDQQSGQLLTAGPLSWTGSFGYMGCPLNPGYPGGSTTGIPWSAIYNAFYNWVVQQVGPVNPGDQIEFNMAQSFNAWGVSIGCAMCSFGSYIDLSKICFEYKGYVPSTNGMGWNGPYVASLYRDCCDGFNPPPPPLTSWDCVITSYNSKPPYTPNYSCVQLPHNQGPFATQQDCLNANCEGTAGPTPVDPIITP